MHRMDRRDIQDVCSALTYLINIDKTKLCLVEGYDGQSPSLSNGMGHVPLSLGDRDNPSGYIDLDGVYEMEGLPQGILSLGRLVTDHGFEFAANGDCQVLTSPNGQEIPVYIEDGIFYVDCHSDATANNSVAVNSTTTMLLEPCGSTTTSFIRSNQQKVDVLELHQRLGHISGQALRDTLHNTYGIKCSNADLDFFCPTCAIAKSRRKAIGQSRDPDLRATRVGERIYTDVKDLKLDIPGRNGFVKYILFVDEFSDYVAIYGLKRKSDAPDTVADLNVELELTKRPYQCHIRPDNDNASYGSEFQQKLKHFELSYDPLPPHTQAHNKAERAIQAIDSMARTLLIDAPHVDFESHYFDATMCAAYIHNRSVGVRGKTPYELVKGEQPYIKHLVPFGCIGYMHAEPQRVGKAVPTHHRAQAVVMLGYRSPWSNQWKVQTQDERKRILHSIHVDWDFGGHGLSNALTNLSRDHLDVLSEQWGVDLQIEQLREPTTTMLSLPEPQVEEANDNTNGQNDPMADAFNNKPRVLIEPLPPRPANANLSNSTHPNNSDVVGSDNNDVVGDPLFSPTRLDIDTKHILDTKRINHYSVVERYATTHKTNVEVALKSALQGDQSQKWKEAIVKEIDSMIENCLLIISEDHPEYETAVREATWSRFVLTRKRDGRFKARWVVQGCFESVELDDFSNRSHVASLEALRALLFRHDRGSRTMAAIDIRTAFLQSDKYDQYEKPRYVKVVNPMDPTKVIYARLLSPMYGQRSAPRRWEDTLAPWLESQDFKRGKNEPSVFHRKSDDTLILVYVDDLLIDGDHDSVHEFLRALTSRFACNDPVYLGTNQPIDFIGIDIFLTSQGIYASSQQYCCKLLENLGMANVKPRETPISGNIVCDAYVADKELHEWYRSAVGGIGWLVACTRPDLAFAFSRLGQHLAAPTEGAVKTLKQTLQYIKGTAHYCLHMPFGLTSNSFEHWSDSDHAYNNTVVDKRKSHTGVISTVNGVPHVYKSSVQPVVTLSSTEAEIYAASQAVSNFEHSKFVLEEMGIQGFPSPFTLMIDNTAAEVFMEDSKNNSRLKHIDVRQLWVQEMRNRDIVIPEHVNTNDNLADLLTKPLAAPIFKKHVERIMHTTGIM